MLAERMKVLEEDRVRQHKFLLTMAWRELRRQHQFLRKARKYLEALE